MFFLDLLHLIKGSLDTLVNGNGTQAIISEKDIEKLANSEIFIARFADSVKAAFPKDMNLELQKPQSAVKNALTMLNIYISIYNEYRLSLQQKTAIEEIMNAQYASAASLQLEQEELKARLKDMDTRAFERRHQELIDRVNKLQEDYKALFTQLNAYSRQINDLQKEINQQTEKIDRALDELIQINGRRVDKVTDILIRSMEHDIKVISDARDGLIDLRHQASAELAETQARRDSLSADHHQYEEFANAVHKKQQEIDKIDQAIKSYSTFIETEKTKIQTIKESSATLHEILKDVKGEKAKEAILEEMTKTTTQSLFLQQNSKESSERLLNSNATLLNNVGGTEKFYGAEVVKQLSNPEEELKATLAKGTNEKMKEQEIKNDKIIRSSKIKEVEGLESKMEKGIQKKEVLDKEKEQLTLDLQNRPGPRP